MNPWIPLVVLSVLAGGIAGLIAQRRSAIIFGATVPWFGLLLILLYHEYIVPYSGGGASMWPIAQLVGGTVAAMIGVLSAIYFGKFNHRK